MGPISRPSSRGCSDRTSRRSGGVVQHYRIYGNEGLHDQLRRVLWELRLHHEDFKRYEESHAVRAYKSLVAKATIFSRMLGDAASAITVGEAIKRLFGP